MKYLTLIPDYTQSCVRDDFNGNVELEEFGLPQDFIMEIVSWHSAYRKIIPLDESQRNVLTNEIDKLDNQGLDFARRIAELVPGGAKVRYFSEGKLKYLFA